MNEEPLSEAHENFTRHFTAAIYEDQASEFAPFGSDEGWDTLHVAAEKRNALTNHSTVADLLEIVDAPATGAWGQSPEAEEWNEDAVFVAAAAFTLLRLTGQIDEPELMQQKKDLERWGSRP